jgi:regulator of replication initiation timing
MVLDEMPTFDQVQPLVSKIVHLRKKLSLLKASLTSEDTIMNESIDELSESLGRMMKHERIKTEAKEVLERWSSAQRRLESIKHS